MRALVLVVLYFNSFTILSQEIGNFNIDNSKVLWQKVYDSKMSESEIIRYFKTSGILIDSEISEKSLIAKIEPIETNMDGLSIKRSSVAIYMLRSLVEGTCTIEFKEGRYRVSMRNINFIWNGGDGMFEDGEKTNAEYYLVKKKGGWKGAFTRGDYMVLQNTFDQLFTIKNRTNEEW